jgi:hypothetical protein
LGTTLENNNEISSPNGELSMSIKNNNFAISISVEGYEEINNIKYGKDGNYTIYEISNLTPNNLGKMAWINGLGMKQEYPDNMLMYEDSNNYSSFPGMKISNNELGESITISECEDKCNLDTTCTSYEYSTDNTCVLNNNTNYHDTTLQMMPTFNKSLYLKQPNIVKQNSTCSKKITNINNQQYNSYLSSGLVNPNNAFMNSDFDCKNSLDNINNLGELSETPMQILKDELSKTNEETLQYTNELSNNTKVNIVKARTIWNEMSRAAWSCGR